MRSVPPGRGATRRARKLLAARKRPAVSVGLFLVMASAARGQQPTYPAERWETVGSPEEVGWSSSGLEEARRYSESLGSAAVMVVYRGKVLTEWGETARKFNVHSIRKSLLSSLYGVFVDRGEIDLDATLEELGIDDRNPLSPQEKKARVVDLLRARSGVYHPALYESVAMAAGRPPRGSHPPGTFWYYNNWDFNTLGTIFEQRTGRKIHQAFKELIADPVRMQDFRAEDGSYFHGDASMHPAYPFRMTARDMARFGLLYLRKGRWLGKQVVPEKWVAESTTAYDRYGYFGGYGYLWWAEVDGDLFPSVDLGEGAFAAWGAGHEPLSNHIIAVIPEHDLVFVHRTNADDDAPWVSSAQIGWILKLILDAKGS